MKGTLINFSASGRQMIKKPGFKDFSSFTFSFFHFFIFSLFCFCGAVSAQEEQFNEIAPPPLKVVSKQEKSALEAETKLPERTKLALLLMDTRLKKAEEFNTKDQFSEMLDELGGFHGLVDDTLKFLDRNDDGRGKVLNNFKRLELSLRKYIPRVELIRRDLPARFEPYVRSLVKNLRAARTRAVEPLFGDTVVPNN